MTWLMFIVTFCSGSGFQTVKAQQACIREVRQCVIDFDDRDADLALIDASLCAEGYDNE